MSVTDFLRDVSLPRMARVRQRFSDAALSDVPAAVRNELRQPEISSRIKSGMSVALAVGSRGMDKLLPLVAATVEELKLQGATPFIVPAMGSHGGATAEGQVALLAGLGITEESVGCEIRSSMETVQLGSLANGLPVLMDKLAMQADGIVPINRVKPHTGFSAELESGLAKMISIGLGNHCGAESCHAQGYGRMGENVLETARIKLGATPIIFGLATVENAYDKVSEIVALPAEKILEKERELLLRAKKNMPRILFSPLDVLVIDNMGKEFSGTGTDPNITGRAPTPYVRVAQQTTRMAILNLSDKSNGNSAGVGLADVITRRLYDKINFEAMYINHLTTTSLEGGRIPVIMGTDKEALQAVVKTCNVLETSTIRMVHIPNTLQIGEIRISEGLLSEAEANPDISIAGELEDWHFDAEGNLLRQGGA